MKKAAYDFDQLLFCPPTWLDQISVAADVAVLELSEQGDGSLSMPDGQALKLGSKPSHRPGQAPEDAFAVI
jgi:hypothetical protein